MSRTSLRDRWNNWWHDRLCRRTAEAILGLHVVGDWASTQLVISQATNYGIEPHQTEVNPLFAPIVDKPALMFSVMLCVGMVLVGILRYEDRRLAQGESKQTRFGRAGLWVIIVLGMIVVVLNLGIGALLRYAPHLIW
jgi:hypothetical protein